MSRNNFMKPPPGLSPEEYMKWRDTVFKKYGKNVFTSLGLELPDDYNEMSGYQQGVIDDTVEEKIHGILKQNLSKDEDAIAKYASDFVEEEDWKIIKEGKIPGKVQDVQFKTFKGRNYIIEFVKSAPDIFLQIILPYITYAPINESFNIMIDIMTPIVPTHWRVILDFHPTITPHYEKYNYNDNAAVSSYCITFKNATELPGAHNIINSVLRKFLSDLVLPQHLA